LANNEPPGFKDRWCRLRATPGKCPFLKDVDQMLVPIAHGEGRFVCRAEWILRGLEQAGQVVLHFCDEAGQPGSFPINPNGSQGDIAGLCDASGRVLGLMPHPERHVLPTQHPHWTRLGLQEEGNGLKLFKNAVAYFS
jgi:phosphoribosylformylglycinamidine synthase